MKKSVRSSKNKVTTIEGLATLMMGEFARVDTSIEKLAVNMATEFDRVDIRLDGIDTRLVAVEEGLRGLRRDILCAR
jgi:hypothetical protein